MKSAISIAGSVASGKAKEASNENSSSTKMTKTERKAAYKDCKGRLEKSIKSWSDTSEDNSDIDSEALSVPSNFKRYTINEQKIVLQQPQRKKAFNTKESYDGPEDAKRVDLANPYEEPRHVYIATDLIPEEEELLISTLKEYRDVFAWSYQDLKVVVV